MKTVFLASFLKDVQKLRDGKVQRAIASVIEQIEAAESLDRIQSLKRLSGHQNYYRVRIGDWRIGLKVENGVVIFVRCLHRREVYRFFP